MRSSYVGGGPFPVRALKEECVGLICIGLLQFLSLVSLWEPSVASVSGGMSVVWLWQDRGGGRGLLIAASAPMPGIVDIVIVLR